MTIQKKQLLDALKLAMPGIETGTATLQGSDAFVFHNGNIFSYNDSISVSVPLSQAGLVEENLEGAVKAEEFFKVIGKFQGDQISFVANEGSWILKSGKDCRACRKYCKGVFTAGGICRTGKFRNHSDCRCCTDKFCDQPAVCCCKYRAFQFGKSATACGWQVSNTYKYYASKYL